MEQSGIVGGGRGWIARACGPVPAAGRWSTFRGLAVWGVGLLLVLAVLLQPAPAIEVADADSGRALLYLPLVDDSTLWLGYVHSVYRQPAREGFRVQDGGFALVELRSRSQAVLEYYARAESIGREGDEYAIRLAGEHYAELPVLVSALGQRTLHYASRQLPLHGLAGDGARVRLRVVRPPRLVTWLAGAPCYARPCP